MPGSGLRRYFLSPPGEGAGYRRLPSLFRGRRRSRLLVLLLLGLAQAALAVVMVLAVKHVFEQAGLGSPLRLAVPAGLAFGALLLAGVLRWREFIEAERLAQGYVHALRLAIFRRAMRLGVEGLRQTSRSVVLLRFTGDLGPIRLWISRGLSRGLVGVTSIVATLAVLLAIDPFVGAAIAVSVLITAAAAMALGGPLDAATRRVRARRTLMLKHVQDRLSRLSVIEAHGDGQEEQRLVSRKSQRLKRGVIRHAYVTGALRAIGEGGASAVGLGAVVVGSLLVASGVASAASIVAALMVAGMLAPKVQDVTRAFEYWTGARISLEKQARLLALNRVGVRNSRAGKKSALPDGQGVLEMSGVGYLDHVTNLTISIGPGQRLWLCTDLSPEQAATALKLAAGVLRPTHGVITLDGTDLGSLRRRDVRRRIALASSQFEVAPGPLRTSITYGVDAERAGQVQALFEQYDLADLFVSLPGGLDYVAGEFDGRITPSQRLLLGVIRARLSGARIILLDQSELRLDAQEAVAVRALLDDFDGGVMWASRERPALESP